MIFFRGKKTHAVAKGSHTTIPEKARQLGTAIRKSGSSATTAQSASAASTLSSTSVIVGKPDEGKGLKR